MLFADNVVNDLTMMQSIIMTLLYRFWSFEILFVATPSVMFVIYSAHKTKIKKVNSRKARASGDDDERASEKHTSV